MIEYLSYMFGNYWAFFLIAGIAGCVVGWFAAGAEPQGVGGANE